jgi:hypothetical protein
MLCGCFELDHPALREQQFLGFLLEARVIVRAQPPCGLVVCVYQGLQMFSSLREFV